MITFKSISWQNFMSYGSEVHKVILNKTQNTLVIGPNGVGKTVIVEALSFALFGKAFRDIKKGQLVNSINGKNCLTTIEFSTNGVEYVVKRGIRPNIFEIWANGVMINQAAALKDYQQVLEKQILKFNYRAFVQVVVLSPANYTPFLKLPVWVRRDIVEELLGIKVLTRMADRLKKELIDEKAEVSKCDNNLKILQEKVTSQKKLIALMNENKATRIQEIDDGIKSLGKERLDLVDEINSLTQDIEIAITEMSKIGDQDDLNQKIKVGRSAVSKKKGAVDAINNHYRLIESNDVCPTCDQDICQAHKDKYKEKSSGEIKELLDSCHEIETALGDFESTLGSLRTALSNINTQKQEIRLKEQQIMGIDRQITTLTNSKIEITGQNSDVEKERDILKKLSAKGLEVVGKKQELQKLIQLQQASLEILGDSGVKARIISEYLPILNQLINRYLQQLDMYISFFLDEEFKETVKSRFRDEFTYDSFSEGEKAKIDLALTLALADIAKMKNSLHTNLVFFDEVDANLDITAVDAYMSLIEARVGNVFAISHKPQLQDKFHSVIRIEKQGDYSVFAKN